MSDKQGILQRLDHYADCMDKGIHVTGTQMKRLVNDIRENAEIRAMVDDMVVLGTGALRVEHVEVLRNMRHGWAAGQISEDEGAALDAAAPQPPAEAQPVAWQRRLLLRDGHWGHWEEYHDLYGEGRPEKVGRFRCEYRPLYDLPPPPSAPEAQPVAGESPADLLNRMGDDAGKWAQEFRATAIKLGYSDMDEGWLIAWFANAIEHSSDVRRWRAEAAPPSAPVGVESAVRVTLTEYSTGTTTTIAEAAMDLPAGEYWLVPAAALAQQPAAVDESRAMKLWDEFREAGNHEHDALTFVLRALAAHQGDSHD